MSARTAAKLGAVVWLTIVWCAVMESVRLGTIAAGIAVGAGLTLLFPTREGTLAGTRFRPLPFLVMNASLFWALIRANLQVAWAVISPTRAGLRRGIVAVPLVPSNELVLDLLLNAVSLTPGTLILEVSREPLVIYIHALQLRSEADLHLQVLGMQRRIAAALGPSDSLAAIDARVAAVRDADERGAPVPALTPEDP